MKLPLWVAAVLLIWPGGVSAQYKRRFDAPPPPPPLMPPVRVGLSVSPAWADCSGTPLACQRLDTRGAGLRVEVMAPLDDGFAMGGRIVHARFGGTPSTSHVTTVEMAAQVHTGFDDAAGVFFGLSYAMISSPGTAGCYGKPGSGLGVEFGVRARARKRLGLSLFAAAIGWPFGTCVESSAWPPPPDAGDPAAIGGIRMVGLGLSYDLGVYRR